MFYCDFSVCRRWNSLIKDGSFWKNIDIAACLLNLHIRRSSSGPSSGSFLTTNFARIERNAFHLIGVYACQNTTQVHLLNASNRVLKLLQKLCPNLDTLILTMALEKHGPNVDTDTLYMDNYKHYKDLKLKLVSKKLTKFHLKPGIYRLTNKNTVLFPRSKPFNVSSLPFPNLEDLPLDTALIDCKVFNRLHTIRCLSLSNCDFRGKADCVSVATVLPHLKCLETLHMYRSLHAFDRFPNELKRFFEVLSKKTTLRCLQLRIFPGLFNTPQQSFYNFEGGIPVDSFENMTIGLENTLSSLGMAYIGLVDDAIVSLIARNLRKLKLVDLSGCNQITDSGFASFSNHPCLEVIDITECKEITYNLIAMAVETLPRIGKLFVTDYPNRTELDWVQFNQVCVRMDYLKVVIKPEYCPFNERFSYTCCSYDPAANIGSRT